MGGIRQNKKTGFTIIEVMIVLAVTGVLFAAAVILLAGKQQKTQFTLAANNIAIQIQQTAGDVTNGYYPNLGDFKCNNGQPNQITNSNSQGTNYGCIFLGKIMQFGMQNLPSTVNIYTLLGNQTADGQSVTGISDATGLQLLEPDISQTPPQDYLEYGLQAVCMQYSTSSQPPSNCTGGTKIGAVGFASNPATQSTSNNTQQVTIVAVPSIGWGSSEPASGFNINQPEPLVVDPTGGVQICFSYGSGSSKSALIQIGGSNRNALVTETIKDGGSC